MTEDNFILTIKSVLLMYKDAAVSAAKDLFRNWLIIVASVLAFFVFIFSAKLVAPFGFAGGMLLGLAQIALLSLYYSWLSEAASGGKLSFKDLLNFDPSLFLGLISVAFILFIALFLVGIVGASSNMQFITVLIHFLIVILFNAIPEVIYIHRYESTHALSYAFNFTFANWIEWFIPFIIVLAPLIYLSPHSALSVVALTEPLLPALAIAEAWNTAGIYYGPILSVIGLIVGNWYMLFRSHLFKDLESGSRRQRVFKAKQRD